MPQYEDTPPPNRRRGEGIRAVISTIAVITAAILFAVLLTSFVFQSYQVDGPSMEPTLQNGDRLIIWKVPRTNERITGKIWVPERGEIIVFVDKGLAPNGSSKQLIKRVIGLPGDRVFIEDGIVTVFNTENPDGFNPDTSLPYGKGQSFPINNNEEVDERVGENQVFVLGDNRNNSLDSRSFGSIEAEDIVGKLKIRMFPLDGARSF
jgi:signal peptidase I